MTARAVITRLVVAYFEALDAYEALTGREDTRTVGEVCQALQRAKEALRNAAGVPPVDPRVHARITSALRELGRDNLPAVDWQEQVLARVQAPRPSWFRRAWHRLAGGRS